MMKHGKIPPQISLKNLNPEIRDLGNDGTVIDPTGSVWPRSGKSPRLAMLNNFGAAGSNGALIVQEYIARSLPVQQQSNHVDTYHIGCSAKSLRGVLSLRDALVRYLKTQPKDLSLRDICYTSTARRQIYDYRLSVTATSIQNLIEKLEDSSPSRIGEGVEKHPWATFAFSGQGSQVLFYFLCWLGMY